MTTSFPRKDDEDFIEALAVLRKHGADVTFITRESYPNGSRRIVREAVVSWQTHNDRPAVL